MTKLKNQQCSKVTSDDYSLSYEEALALLKQLDPQWQIQQDKVTISQTFEFENFYQTMAFVNVVAQIAHQQDHHPDILASYNRCTVSYSTHSVDGLTINDFVCAAKINAAQSL